MESGRKTEGLEFILIQESDEPQWKYNLQNQIPQRGGKRKQPPSKTETASSNAAV
jgi:hypothetical protein